MNAFSPRVRKNSLFCGYTALALLIISMAFMVGTLSVAAQADDGTYALFDAVDNDNSVTWVNGSEPGSYPFFDVKLMLTNVTNAYAASFSLEYDTALLNYSSHVWGDAFDYTGKVVLPLDPTIDYANGYIIEGSMGQLGPTAQSVKNFTDPTWGWVATFTFEFIGTPPTIGSPINTLISITNRAGPPSMTSLWWKFESTPPERPFNTLTPCTFHYETVQTLIHVVESFNVVTVSNTIVSTPILNTTQATLNFNVTGQAGMTGFCNISLPKGLMTGILGVTVDSALPDSLTTTENATHTFVDLTYTLASTLQVTILAEWVIPEFQALTFVVVLMISTIAAVMIAKTFRSIKRRSHKIIK